MEDNRVIDGAMPHPEQDEPQEKEFLINAIVPMMVECTVYGYDSQDAIDRAKYEMRKGLTKTKIIDRHFNNTDVTHVEEV